LGCRAPVDMSNDCSKTNMIRSPAPIASCPSWSESDREIRFCNNAHRVQLPGRGRAARLARRGNRSIERDIARQQQQAGPFELSNAAYPVMARILKVRRDNRAATGRKDNIPTALLRHQPTIVRRHASSATLAD